MQNYFNIIGAIKQQRYKPIYFLYGNEPYYIDKISKYIEQHVLTDEQKGFNLLIFYGKDTDVETIVTAARRYPVMSPRQIIIVKEAQNLTNINKLQNYFSSPTKSTILLICYKHRLIDKRTKLSKLVVQNGVLFEAKKLYENQIPSWINSIVKNFNYTISPKATMMLTDFLGNNLTKIENELKKLIINIPQGDLITPTLVEKYIGISKEYNNFELQNAIGKKNNYHAQEIVNFFSSNPSKYPVISTISTLFYFFKKVLILHISKRKTYNDTILASKLGIHPFFLKDYKLAATNYNAKKILQIISLLRMYDLKAKGYNSASTMHSSLLKELIIKITH